MIRFYDNATKLFLQIGVESIALNTEIFNPDEPLSISSNYSFGFNIPTSRSNLFILTNNYDNPPVSAVGLKKDIVMFLEEQSIYGYISVESLDNGMLNVRFISYISKFLSTLEDLTPSSLPYYDLDNNLQTFNGYISRNKVIESWNNCLTNTEDKWKVFQFVPGYNMEQMTNFDTEHVYDKSTDKLTELPKSESEYAINDVRSYSMRLAINVRRMIHSIKKYIDNINESYKFNYEDVEINDKDFITGNKNPSNQEDYESSTSSLYLNPIYNFRSINAPIIANNKVANVDITVDMSQFDIQFSSRFSNYRLDKLYPLGYFKTSDTYSRMVRNNAVAIQIIGDNYSTIQVFTSWPTASEYSGYAIKMKRIITEQLSYYNSILHARMVNVVKDNIEFIQARLKFNNNKSSAKLVNNLGEDISLTFNGIDYNINKPLKVAILCLPTYDSDTIFDMPSDSEYTNTMFPDESCGLLGINKDGQTPFCNTRTGAHLSNTVNFTLNYNEATYITGEDLRISRYFSDINIKDLFLDYLKLNNLSLVQTSNTISITNETLISPNVVYSNTDSMNAYTENGVIKLIKSSDVDYSITRIINSKVTGYQQATSNNNNNINTIIDTNSYSGKNIYDIETIGVGDLYVNRSSLFGNLNNFEDIQPKILFNNNIPILVNLIGMSSDMKFITDYNSNAYDKNSNTDIYVLNDNDNRTESYYPLFMPYRNKEQGKELLMVGVNDKYLYSNYTFKPVSGKFMLSSYGGLRTLSMLNRYKLTINNYYIGDLTTCFQRMIYFDSMPFRLVQVNNYNTNTKTCTAIFVSNDIIK